MTTGRQHPPREEFSISSVPVPHHHDVISIHATFIRLVLVEGSDGSVGGCGVRTGEWDNPNESNNNKTLGIISPTTLTLTGKFFGYFASFGVSSKTSSRQLSSAIRLSVPEGPAGFISDLENTELYPTVAVHSTPAAKRSSGIGF